MESLLLVLAIVVITLFSFTTIGSLVAYRKRRTPMEGLILGLFLGPIGIAIEAVLSSWTRPEVDQGAWQSFRLMVSYQERLARSRHSRQSVRVPRRSRSRNDFYRFFGLERIDARRGLRQSQGSDTHQSRMLG